MLVQRVISWLGNQWKSVHLFKVTRSTLRERLRAHAAMMKQIGLFFIGFTVDIQQN